MTPFQIAVTEADLQDLADRLTRTRWSEAAGFDDWDDGTPPDYARSLVEHWRDGFDWRAR